MCIVSAVGDHFKDKWTDPYRKGQIDFFPNQTLPLSPVSRKEFEELKAEVEECKRLLLMAKEIDEKTGQKDCEMEEKVALIKAVAKAVGVDLSEVFPE